MQESSQSNYVSLSRATFPCGKVTAVKRTGSSEDNNDKALIYLLLYLLCFIDLLYFIKVLGGNKEIKKFCQIQCD